MFYKSENLQFLESEYSDLYRVGSLCEFLMNIDTEACVAKLRVFGELWLYTLNKVNGDGIKVSGNFGQQIRSALNKKLITDDFELALERFRKLGNRGIHISESYVTGNIQKLNIPKLELINCLQDVFSLSEYIYKKTKTDEASVPQWKAPRNFSECVVFGDALIGDGKACYEVAISYIERLKELPDNNERANLEQIREFEADIEYWLIKSTKANFASASKQLAYLYNGKFNSKTENKDKCSHWLNKALELDDDGTVHLIKGNISYNNNDLIQAEKYWLLSFDMGCTEVFNQLLDLYKNDEEKYLTILDKGIGKKISQAAVLKFLKLVTKDNINEITLKKLLTLSKVTSAPGRRYIEGIARVLGLFGLSDPDEESMKLLINYWSELPEHSVSAMITIFIIHGTEYHYLVTSKLATAALKQANGTSLEGEICFACAQIGYVACLEKNVSIAMPYTFDKLINRSITLGYKKAIEFKKQFNSGRVNQTNINKNKLDKRTKKAKRKQSRAKKK